MLVLSRKVNESVRIGADIEVKVIRIEGGKVRLAFTAPRDVSIVRTEIEEPPPEHPLTPGC